MIILDIVSTVAHVAQRAKERQTPPPARGCRASKPVQGAVVPGRSSRRARREKGAATSGGNGARGNEGGSSDNFLLCAWAERIRHLRAVGSNWGVAVGDPN